MAGIKRERQDDQKRGRVRETITRQDGSQRITVKDPGPFFRKIVSIETKEAPKRKR